MPRVVVDTYDPNIEEETLAIQARLERNGYFGSDMEQVLSTIAATIVENAKADCVSGAASVEFARGVIQGARAITGHLGLIRERAAGIMKARIEQGDTKTENLSLGDGTLSGGML